MTLGSTEMAGPQCTSIATNVKKASRELWLRWIAVLLWSGVISLQSANTFSSMNTRQFLYSLLLRLGVIDLFGINWTQVIALNSGLRIAGHLLGYGILSWLAYCAWRSTLLAVQPMRRVLWSAALAMVLTGAVAVLDELHQSLLPGRRGTVNDILLDSAAAAAVQLFVLAHFKFRRTAVISGAHADGIEDRG